MKWSGVLIIRVPGSTRAMRSKKTGRAAPKTSRNNQQPDLKKAGAFNGTARPQGPNRGEHDTVFSESRSGEVAR